MPRASSTTPARSSAKARYDTLMAQLKLKAAAGSLVEDDIKAINALLD
jgi:outer membrane protein